MLQLQPHERIILADDASFFPPDEEHRRNALCPHIGGLKIGLEVMTAGKADLQLNRAARHQLRVMWDGKYNDIPNTVGNAVKNTAAHGVWGMTVMANTGMKSIQAAVANRGESLIIGVTVLTSISSDECLTMYGDDPTAMVEWFARLLVNAGAQAIVCSPLELERVRKSVGDQLICITPGIRAKDARQDDQNRTMTAGDAIKAGADYLVIGRPIMQARDPVAAAKAIGEEIASAQANRSMV